MSATAKFCSECGDAARSRGRR
ncbi:hypothetical protein [Mycobacterium sp.]